MQAISATTPQLLRRVNAGAVLSALMAGRAVTGTDLIAETGLTRSTVHAVCNDLIAMGWVRELETLRDVDGPQKGRPSKRFAFNSRAACVLGVDLGHAKTTVLAADLSGETLGRASVSFDEATDTPATRIHGVEQAALEAVAAAGMQPQQVLSVSVGVAAPVSRDGAVLATEKFWQIFDIGVDRALHERQGWNVRLENDANLAALGERWHGVAAGVDDLVALLSGERFGAGVVESGRLLHGSNGGAGEMRYLDLVDGVGSADGIGRVARQWGMEAVARGRARTALRELAGGSPQAVTAEMVFAAAADGDRVASRILDRLADRLARVVASVSILLNPELVVIGGAVAAAAGPLVDAAAQRVPELTTATPRLAVSSLGSDAVSVGAVRHALDFVAANALDIPLRR